MEPTEANQLANDLMGSAHVLVAAILNIKNAVLADVAGKRLSFSQLKILKLVDFCGPQGVGEIAAFLCVTDAAASKSVDYLVRRRYLRRAVGKPDRRHSELSLTAAGRKILREYDASKDRVVGEALRQFDRDDVRQTVAFLDRLTGALVNGSARHEEICLQCRIYLRQRCLIQDAARTDCQYHRRRRSRETDPRQPLKAKTQTAR